MNYSVFVDRGTIILRVSPYDGGPTVFLPITPEMAVELGRELQDEAFTVIASNEVEAPAARCGDSYCGDCKVPA